MSEPLKIDLSTMSFRDPDTRRTVAENFFDYAGKTGAFTPGVQIHNTSDVEMIGFVRSLNRDMSMHLPVLSEKRWNFGTENVDWNLVDSCVKTASDLNIVRTCFHGFVMTDSPLGTFGKNVSYSNAMKNAYRPELFLEENCTLNRDFTREKEYRERLEFLRKNLAVLRTRHPETLLCLENDFPSFGSGALLPEDITQLEHPLCLDTSHLWATDHLFDRDFLRDAFAYLDSGLVKMIHLHASVCDDSLPKNRWHDGHRILSEPNSMSLDRLVFRAYSDGVRHFVLECPATWRDAEILLNWIERIL